jgi:hypothetical protein
MKVMLKGNEPGLAAYYRFDEGTGTSATRWISGSRATAHRASRERSPSCRRCKGGSKSARHARAASESPIGKPVGLFFVRGSVREPLVNRGAVSPRSLTHWTRRLLVWTSHRDTCRVACSHRRFNCMHLHVLRHTVRMLLLRTTARPTRSERWCTCSSALGRHRWPPQL